MTVAWLRRRHRALWIACEYSEPLGVPTWTVWAVRSAGEGGSVRLARTRWLWLAVLTAIFVPVTRKQGIA